MDLIADDNVELVDICLPTPLHLEYAKAALQARKHLMIDKPLARTSAEAAQLAELADQAGVVAMPGMCMRFWPGWDWLKQAIDERRYGNVLAAQFRRVTSHPGGPFYSDGKACGGVILDLHIHDTDFIQWCFGPPKAVSSHGYTKLTGEIDHVFTHYLYGDDGPNVVTAEGGWALQEGFGFEMQFCVNFENATAVFDLSADATLKLIKDGQSQAVELPAGMGYEHKIAYLLDCIAAGRKPQRVTVRDAAASVAIVEAEAQIVREDKPIAVKI